MRLRLTLLVAAALAACGGDFRFAVLGDRTGRAAPGVFEQTWREVAAERPAFAITVGDLIEGGELGAADREWRALKRVWGRYGIPLFFTPGNHDYWNAASRALWERVTGRPPAYGFDWEGAHFTVLDNSRGMLLDAGQMRFLEQDLAAHEKSAPKFVFFHEPFWLVYLKLGSGEFPLHALARRYRIDCVVSGHGHQFVTVERDGTSYVEMGSSGASMTRSTARGEGFRDGWFYQFGVMEVKGARASFVIHELGPPFGRGRVVAVR